MIRHQTYKRGPIAGLVFSAIALSFAVPIWAVDDDGKPPATRSPTRTRAFRQPRGSD